MISSIDPNLKKSIKELGFSEYDTKNILYNIKCGLSLKEAIDVLQLKPEDIKKDNKVKLCKLVDGEFKSLGRVDLTNIVRPSCIIKTNYRYVWFSLFGETYRYRKQSNNEEDCFL